MNDQAISDIGRHIAAKVQDLLQRETNIARHVLDGQELSFVLMKLAVSITGGAITGALQTRNDKATTEQMYDNFASAIHEGVKAIKPEYLAKLAEIEAGRSAAA